MIDEVDDNQYLAKLASYAREKVFMKDMRLHQIRPYHETPARPAMHRVFNRMVDNGSVLRTVIRSGQFKD